MFLLSERFSLPVLWGARGSLVKGVRVAEGERGGSLGTPLLPATAPALGKFTIFSMELVMRPDRCVHWWNWVTVSRRAEWGGRGHRLGSCLGALWWDVGGGLVPAQSGRKRGRRAHKVQNSRTPVMSQRGAPCTVHAVRPVPTWPGPSFVAAGRMF